MYVSDILEYPRTHCHVSVRYTTKSKRMGVAKVMEEKCGKDAMSELPEWEEDKIR